MATGAQNMSKDKSTARKDLPVAYADINMTSLARRDPEVFAKVEAEFKKKTKWLPIIM